MIQKISEFIFFKLWGLSIKGKVPDAKKYLIVVAPHTSNKDFFIGILSRNFLDYNPRFLGKKELFVFPIGYLFRALGGYPIERSKNTNFVDSLVNVYNSKEEFITTITPEGTRSYNPKWKTGFYYIAKNANIPILRVGFDIANKTIVFDDLYWITKGVEETVIEFKKYFSQFKGFNPEKGVIWPE